MSKEGASSRRASVVTRTERLLLRDLRSSDREAVHKYSSDPDVVQYMDWGPNTDKDDKEFLERTITAQKENPRRNFTLAIIMKDTRRLIGSCGIHESNPADREGWIGYCLNRRYWHQGFGTETAKALLEFGFNHLRLHRIFATCMPANTASAHVLEKTGMQLEGHLRQHRLVKGEWRDSFLYAILDEEWQHLKGNQQTSE
ncbi:GNAT family N-acetyltransferase [Candidatus Bathyarchaeota archaeon]|nr:GNAT family N-acetyltransferase [Candidatus Bathyarchaeota archaeon]